MKQLTQQLFNMDFFQNNQRRIKKWQLLNIIYLSAVMTLGWISPVFAKVYYVKTGPINGNGMNWGKAFNNVDSALAAASSHPGQDEVWIAKGKYIPSIIYSGKYSGNESNLKTFNLPSDVAVYGGFAGTEMKLEQRNGSKNQTILSGDQEGNDINTPSTTNQNKEDNSWHVLTADGVTNVLLDSLIVQGGYAAGPDAGTLGDKFTLKTLDYRHAAGGGLTAQNGATITLNNMSFDYNASNSHNAIIRGPSALGAPALASGGGAISSKDEHTVVTIKYSRFEHNTSFEFGGNGGALSAVLNGSFDISFSAFNNNLGNRNGGAIHGKDADHIKIHGSLIKNNKITGAQIGDESGGGIGLINTSLSVSSSVFEDNSSGPAGGGGIIFQIPFDDGVPYILKVEKSIFKNNQGGSLGGGAIIIFGVTPHVGTEASITETVFSDNSGGIGGALYVDSIPTQITKSAFVNNKAWVNGGAIFGSNFGDAIFGITDLSKRTLLSISETSFKENSIVGIPPGDLFPPAVVLNIFANFQSFINNIPPAGVTALTPGGGAIAVELGGNVHISGSVFYKNSALGGYGGALLVGGSQGFSGTTNLGMNQAFSVLENSYCADNFATSGGDNTYVLDPANLGNIPNGVQLIENGGC